MPRSKVELFAATRQGSPFLPLRSTFTLDRYGHLFPDADTLADRLDELGRGGDVSRDTDEGLGA